ncbi:hypothetical protein [Pelagicoccus sp. SDUM812003]|uniref:hypothetical protein n=1 Tax=Pelagicoccus sp. SDUM812003 TaxID=3041267 RepID=UPI00280FF99A|nr:hypothetical protein [Pelagicoccus sp. SDUM812003]MDQ8202603.1 hypothetical protein [Pelagicoccus sp. SDUM812003]
MSWYIMRFRLSLIAIVLLCASAARGQDAIVQNSEEEAPSWKDVVRTYEPIYVGYTFDEDDQAFMDFSLSVMTPASILLPWRSWNPQNKFPDRVGSYQRTASKWQPRMYIAFSGRAGQYIGTRESSPVVGKRFNPLFSLRWWQEDTENRSPENATGRELGLYDYFELSYGHESNGQSIGDVEDPQTPEEMDLGRLRYEARRREAEIVDGDTDIARDDLSRGWDYIGARWANSWKHDNHTWYLQLDGRYYLSDGLLQGEAEEYNLWENDGDWLARYDGEITRSKVDGLRATLRYRSQSLNRILDANEASIEVRTGYEDPFERLTVKLELGFKYTSLWYRYGYNSDLVNYYHKDESWGIAIRIRQF